MKKTGQLLKDKREAAKLSLSEVALATKINPKVLTAIEEGDEARLPAKTFLKGFLKAYALFLKTDVDEILRSYQDELGGPAPVREHEINKPPPVVTPSANTTSPSSPSSPAPRRRMGEENSSGLRTAAVVVIVMLIGVIIGVRELIEKYQREKTVETATVKVTPLEQPPLVPETAKTGELAPGSATPAAAVTPTTPAPGTPVNSAAPAAAATVETPAPSKPAAQNDMIVSKTAPTPAPAAAVPAPSAPTPPPVKPTAEVPKPVDVAPPTSDTVNTDPAPAVKKIGKNEIILEALDKVDVKFQIKGETKRVSLGPTQVHTIHSDQPVTIDLSDGGAVNIILNGRERGVPGDLGKPKTIKIP